jgi:hypothetical protein
MAVHLNRSAFTHARELIEAGKFVFDERDAWSEHQPSAEEENEFIARYGFAEYAKWYLGINDEKRAETKGHYEFPYGDFKKVHRCGVITAESRAGQYKHFDVEKAAAQLHEMIDENYGRTPHRGSRNAHRAPAPHRSVR